MTDRVFPHPVRTTWKQLAILRRDNPGISNVECGRQLGVTTNSIGAWLRAPLYQSFENWLLETTYEAQPISAKVSRAEMKEELDEFAGEMLHRLREIVEYSADDKLIAQIGFDALDRAGYAEPKRDSQRSVQVLLTPELLTILMRRSAEAVESVDGEIVGELMPAQEEKSA